MMKNIKILFVILALVCFTTSFVSCSPNSVEEDEEVYSTNTDQENLEEDDPIIAEG